MLAWLLGEAAGEEVRVHLADAKQILASQLTVVECERALSRGVATGAFEEVERARRRRVLGEAAKAWHQLSLSEAVLTRARQPFPVEPIRTLDALHLASALRLQPALPALQVLTLDQRIRENAPLLGFRVLPSLDELGSRMGA